MPLKKEQLELLRKSNKTLAIMGLFSSRDDNKIRYVFNNSGEQDGVVSAADFFARVKPELRSSSAKTFTIGDKKFNNYDLHTPLQAGDKGLSQPILHDSRLLDADVYLGNDAKQIQDMGRDEIKSLVDHLDVVAYFTHSNFPKSLLKIAKEYLFAEATKNLEDRFVDVAQWQNTFNSDHFLCAEIVQYLTAYQQDELEIITTVKSRLKSFEKDEKPLYTTEQVTALSNALVKCKRVMMCKPSMDNTWSKIAGFDGFSWLEDYPSDPTYGIRCPGVGNKTFHVHYQKFIKASDDIHRLVRTQAIHSSIFCWLASKYKEWDEGVTSINNVAQEMFNLGVKGQDEERIRGESQEARCRNLKLIKEAKVDEAEFDNEDELNELSGDENYEKFASMAENDIFDALLPDRSVTRKALLQRAKNLFTKLSQIAGGKAGELLKKNQEFNHLFVKYYRTILNTDTEKNSTVEDFQSRLEEQARRDNEARNFYFDAQEFVKSVVDIASQEQTNNDVKDKVKEAFIKEFARVSKTRFARLYLENQDQIEKEEQLAADLYSIRSMNEVSSDGEKAGAAAIVVADLAMPDFKQVNKSILDNRKDKLKREMVAGVEKNIPSYITAPKTTAIAVLEAGRYNIENTEAPQEKPIGIFEVTKDDVTVTPTRDHPENAKKLTEKGAIVKIKDREYPLILIEVVDIPMLEELSPKDVREARETIKTVGDKYEQLSKAQDNILEKYCNKDKHKPEPLLNKGLRALLLSEYILAAPKGSTQLNTPDLSQILGVMIDIVEYLGEMGNDKILDGVLVGTDNENLLQKINLSKYYPVNNGDELSTFLQYQLTLCQQLNQVQDYLKEIAELRDCFEAMRGTDLEIVVLNTTLGKYAKVNQLEEFSPNVDSPSIMYLTSQAEVDGTNLQQMATTLQGLSNTTDTEKLQIPIFLTSKESPGIQGLGIPVITGNPDFQTWQSIVLKNTKYNPYLCLAAASLLPESSDSFGRISQLNFSARKEMKEKFDINVRDNETVVEVLHKIWLSQNCRLVDTFIFTKWLNVVLSERDSDNLPKDWNWTLDKKILLA